MNISSKFKWYVWCLLMMTPIGVSAQSPMDAATPEVHKAVEYQTKLSQMEQNQEKMRKEIETMRLQMEYDKVRREAHGVELPGVVAIYFGGGRAAALLQDQSGQRFYVSPGDVLGDGYRIQTIDLSGVWVTQGKSAKKIRLMAATPMQSGSLSGVPLPPPSGISSFAPPSGPMVR